MQNEERKPRRRVIAPSTLRGQSETRKGRSRWRWRTRSRRAADIRIGIFLRAAAERDRRATQAAAERGEDARQERVGEITRTMSDKQIEID